MLESALAQVIEEYHRGLDAFLQGDPEPVKRLWSRRDDVTLANPFGPPVRGWQQVEATFEQAGSQIRDGEPLGVERISEVMAAELAYVVEVYRRRVRVGSTDEFAVLSLRVTTIFRREDGEWRITHRHADSITAPRSLESVLGR